MTSSISIESIYCFEDAGIILVCNDTIAFLTFAVSPLLIPSPPSSRNSSASSELSPLVIPHANRSPQEERKTKRFKKGGAKARKTRIKK